MSTQASTAQATRFDLKVTPVFYGVRGQIIPTGLNLTQRCTFIRGLGASTPEASVLAMQDRGSSLAAALGYLVQLSDNPALIQRAEAIIAQWNRECEDFFEQYR